MNRAQRTMEKQFLIVFPILLLLTTLTEVQSETFDQNDDFKFEKQHPKILVKGHVVCDQCGHGHVGKTSLPLHDAEVGVKCMDLYGFITFSGIGYTDTHGIFSIAMDEIPAIFGIKGCKAKLIRAPNSACNVVSTMGEGLTGAPLLLMHKSLSEVIFTSGPFACRPSEPPKLCRYIRKSPPPVDVYKYVSPPPPFHPPPSTVPSYHAHTPPPPAVHSHHSPPPLAHPSPPEAVSPVHKPPPPPFWYKYISPPPPPQPAIHHPPPPKSSPPSSYKYKSPPPPSGNSGFKSHPPPGVGFKSPPPPSAAYKPPVLPYKSPPERSSPPPMHWKFPPPPLAPHKTYPPHSDHPPPNPSPLQWYRSPPPPSGSVHSTPPNKSGPMYVSPPPPARTAWEFGVKKGKSSLDTFELPENDMND